MLFATHIARNLVTVFFLLLVSINALAQQNPGKLVGSVTDAETREPLAFAKVFWQQSRAGTLTDIEGRFVLPIPTVADTLEIWHVGHVPVKVFVAAGTAKLTLKAQPKAIALTTVTIRPTDNPALAIIRAAIAKRLRNNPEQWEAFTYESHNKLSLKPLELKTDTAGRKVWVSTLAPEFKKDGILGIDYFFLETTTRRTYGGKGRNQEVVNGSRFPGVQGFAFGLLPSSFQDFSFYKDYVTIAALSFTSPLHQDGPTRYDYTLEDSTVHPDGQRTYLISYRPLRKTEQAFKGFMRLRTPHYNIENIRAELVIQNNEQGFERGTIQQLHAVVDSTVPPADVKWFPTQLLTDIQLAPPGQAATQRFQFAMRSDFTQVKTPPLSALPKLRGDEVVVQDDAGSQPEAFWTARRVTPLSQNENVFMQKFDSMGRVAKPNPTKVFNQLDFLLQGQVAIGPFSLDLARMLYLQNRLEGWRPSVALSTNPRLSKWFELNGYGTYGFADSTWKRGGGLRLFPNKMRDHYISLRYDFDTYETAGNRLDGAVQIPLYNQRRYNLQQFSYRLFVFRQMDYREQFSAQWVARLTPALQAQASYLHSYVRTPYAFTFDGRSGITFSEATATLRWAPAEGTVVKGVVRQVISPSRVSAQVRFTQGLPGQGEANANLRYWKVEANWLHKLELHRAGRLRYYLSYARAQGRVPYYNLFMLPGMSVNSGQFSDDENFTFLTAGVHQFIASELAMGALLYQLPIRLGTPTSLFAPRFYVNQRMAWGQINDYLGDGPLASIAQAPNKGYYESGITINGLFERMPPPFNIALGVAVYYRYGPYAAPQPNNNVFGAVSATRFF
jgi:hypothetical protein